MVGAKRDLRRGMEAHPRVMEIDGKYYVVSEPWVRYPPLGSKYHGAVCMASRIEREATPAEIEAYHAL